MNLCWHPVLEQLQRPELAASVFPDRQQERERKSGEGLRWPVSANMSE